MFKKLKQKLISDNRLGKYLTYALGEIILIVIGILVAMNLDDWNDNRKDIAEAQNLIKELRFDLKRDTMIFGDEIRKIDQLILYKGILLEKDSIGKVDTDIIISVLTVGIHNIKMNEGSYEKIKESNIASLDEYKDLFKRINSYYIFNKAYLENRNSWEANLFERDLDQWVYQDQFEVKFPGSDKDLQNPEIKRKNLLKMLESPKGRNVLKMSLFREKQMKETYEFVLKASNKLLVKIDSLHLK
ncbi:MAG: DUF6090 family protein [Flavobacterium sp.]